MKKLLIIPMVAGAILAIASPAGANFNCPTNGGPNPCTTTTQQSTTTTTKPKVTTTVKQPTTTVTVNIDGSIVIERKLETVTATSPRFAG